MKGKSEIKLEPSTITIRKVLEGAIKDTNRLSKEADDAIWEESNPIMHYLALKERARIIIELPQKISRLIEQGQTFPENEMAVLNDLAFIANEALKEGKAFPLGLLLIDKGSKQGEPNQL